MIIYMYLHICISSGCDNFHDGLVCWPRTLAGSTAEVDCLENPAVAVALDSVGEIIFYLHSQYEVLAFSSNYVNIILFILIYIFNAICQMHCSLPDYPL